MAMPIVYLDDADAFAAWVVTDADGQDLDWTTPQIAIGDGPYLAAEWQGTPAPTREIRLPMPLGLSLEPDVYGAYLKVPNGNDLNLGAVYITNRT